MHVYRPEHSIIQAPSDVLDRSVLNLIDFLGKAGRCYNKLEFEGRVLLILKSPPNAGKVFIGNERKNQVYSSYYVLCGCRMASN